MHGGGHEARTESVSLQWMWQGRRVKGKKPLVYYCDMQQRMLHIRGLQ